MIRPILTVLWAPAGEAASIAAATTLPNPAIILRIVVLPAWSPAIARPFRPTVMRERFPVKYPLPLLQPSSRLPCARLHAADHLTGARAPTTIMRAGGTTAHARVGLGWRRRGPGAAPRAQERLDRGGERERCLIRGVMSGIGHDFELGLGIPRQECLAHDVLGQRRVVLANDDLDGGIAPLDVRGEVLLGPRLEVARERLDRRRLHGMSDHVLDPGRRQPIADGKRPDGGVLLEATRGAGKQRLRGVLERV